MSQSIASLESKQRQSLNAIAALVSGITAVSFAAIFIRFSEQEIGPYATIAHRFWMATVALAAWEGGKRLYSLWIKSNQATETQATHEFHESPTFSSSDWGLLLLAGSITGVDMAVWALSLTQTSVANSTVLANLAPLFTALGSWVLWKQRFEARYWIGLALALGGAFTIGLGDLQLGHWQGDAIALLSAVLFSAYLLTLERLREKLSATVLLLSCSGIAAVVTTGISLSLEQQFFPSSLKGWLAVIGLALVSQTIGQGLVTYSLDRLSSGLVAMTFLLEPAIAAVVAWILFSEALSVVNLAGFTLVIVGVYQALSSPSAIKEDK
ncbi:MAG: DMT family transporter [Cyanobacteria bacterium P01_F01_bin.42]